MCIPKSLIRRIVAAIAVAALFGNWHSTATAAQRWSGDFNNSASPGAGFPFNDDSGYLWNQLLASSSSWALLDNNGTGGVTLSVVSQSVGGRGAFASSNGGNNANNPIGRDYMWFTTTVNSAGGVGTINMQFSGVAANSPFKLILLGGTEFANRHFEFSVDGGASWHEVQAQQNWLIPGGSPGGPSFPAGDLIFGTPPSTIPPSTSLNVNSNASGQIDFMVRKNWYAAGDLGGNSNEGDWAGFQLQLVPEPATPIAAMFALGAPLVLAWRRRHRA